MVLRIHGKDWINPNAKHLLACRELLKYYAAFSHCPKCGAKIYSTIEPEILGGIVVCADCEDDDGTNPRITDGNGYLFERKKEV